MKNKLIIFLATFLLLLIQSTAVRADKFLEGVKTQIDEEVIINAEMANTWEWRINRPGTKFIRVSIRADEKHRQGEYFLTFHDTEGKTLDTISSTTIYSDGGVISRMMYSDSIRLRVSGLPEHDHARFTIVYSIHQERSASPYSITDPNQIENIVRYESDWPRLFELRKLIAKLSFASEGKSYSCTAFLVDHDKVLTNHHCVNSLETCLTTEVIFSYVWYPVGHDREGLGSEVGSSFCVEVVSSDEDLDFALLRLSEPREISGHVLQWPLSDAVLGEQAIMLQHPRGEHLQVTRVGCSVKTLNAMGVTRTTDIGHECDTLQGSSGSPLFNSDLELIGLHHYGFDYDQVRWKAENRAVQSRMIWNVISQYLGE